MSISTTLAADWSDPARQQFDPGAVETHLRARDAEHNPRTDTVIFDLAGVAVVVTAEPGAKHARLRLRALVPSLYSDADEVYTACLGLLDKRTRNERGLRKASASMIEIAGALAERRLAGWKLIKASHGGAPWHPDLGLSGLKLYHGLLFVHPDEYRSYAWCYRNDTIGVDAVRGIEKALGKLPATPPSLATGASAALAVAASKGAERAHEAAVMHLVRNRPELTGAEIAEMVGLPATRELAPESA